MTHEFDHFVWKNEPDIVDPDRPTLSADSVVLRWLSQWIREHNIDLTADDSLLALASGQSHAEIKIADCLGINRSNITLVDHRFYPDTAERLRREYSETEIVESGMFAYLKTPSKRDFTLVTVLGVEYALDSYEAVDELSTLLPNVLKDQGVAAIFPCTVRDTEQMWRDKGFQPIFPYSVDGCLMYQLNSSLDNY